MSSAVTMAKMCKLESDQPIYLPKEFIKALTPGDKNYAVMVIAPNTKIIRIIPTSSDEVIKISINIGKLSPDFLNKMGSIFIKLGIKTLYSTGLCFTQESCVYEGYIDKAELKGTTVDIIKNELLNIDGVSSVEIENLKVAE